MVSDGAQPICGCEGSEPLVSRQRDVEPVKGRNGNKKLRFQVVGNHKELLCGEGPPEEKSSGDRVRGRRPQ